MNQLAGLDEPFDDGQHRFHVDEPLTALRFMFGSLAGSTRTLTQQDGGGECCSSHLSKVACSDYCAEQDHWAFTGGRRDQIDTLVWWRPGEVEKRRGGTK